MFIDVPPSYGAYYVGGRWKTQFDACDASSVDLFDLDPNRSRHVLPLAVTKTHCVFTRVVRHAGKDEGVPRLGKWSGIGMGVVFIELYVSWQPNKKRIDHDYGEHSKRGTTKDVNLA